MAAGPHQGGDQERHQRQCAGGQSGQSALGGALPVTSVATDSVTTEFHDVYFDWSLRPYDMAPWFSNQYLTEGSTQSFTINVPDAAGGAATLVVNLWSVTSADSVNPDHALQVSVNGRAAGQAHWDGGGQLLKLSPTTGRAEQCAD